MGKIATELIGSLGYSRREAEKVERILLGSGQISIKRDEIKKTEKAGLATKSVSEVSTTK